MGTAAAILIILFILLFLIISFEKIEINCDDIKEKQEFSESHLLGVCERLDKVEKKLNKVCEEESGSITYLDILYEKFCRENPTLKVDKEILTKVLNFCNEQGKEGVNKNENEL